MSLWSPLVEEGLKECFFCCLLFLPQQGDVVLPNLNGTGFFARRDEGLFGAWLQQPSLVSLITCYLLSQAFAALKISKCLSSCWCNCMSINPHIKRLCHLIPGFTLMQICRYDYPVYCIYKCLIIYLTETLVHQHFYMPCSRTMHIQGFCCILFRVMWKRVALSLGFFNLTYLVLFLTA